MKRTFMNIISILTVLLVCQDVFADEGMWMVQSIDRALEKKMQERGLKLAVSEIYNADAEGATLADAIVSLDFGCTGSLISDQGLVITNHHCAYCDVHALSTLDRNYLENGFWARSAAEEQHIPNKNAYLLKRVIDVTEEAEAYIAEYARCHRKSQVNGAGRFAGQQGECSMRKLSAVLERRWKEKTGMEAWLYSMWKGSRYYIALYEVYSDLRLVAAPPVSASAFGGDIDNWEWPQHKCDFAMYRIYTAPDGSPASYSPDNVPMKSPTHLKISTDGYQEGDFTMILGYPGRTDRYSNAFETDFEINRKLPVCNRLRGEQMRIINGWMNQDEKIRLQYADYYFSLSNVQELQDGEVKCSKRFNVLDIKEDTDRELQEWIESDPGRKARWGNLLETIGKKYEATQEIERNINYYRETLIRGVRFNRILFRIRSLREEVLQANGITPKRRFELKDGTDPVETEACRTIRFKGKELTSTMRMIQDQYASFDLRVEKDLFHYALEEFYRNVSPEYWGTYQQELHERFTDKSFHATELADWLWQKSYITDQERFKSFLAEEHTIDEYFADPMFRFFNDIDITTFTLKLMKVEGMPKINRLNKEYTQALYRMRVDKGIPVYPDANSSMRLTYGTVGGIEPWDAVIKNWFTTTDGILEKHDSSRYEFRLDERQKVLYETRDWGRWDCGNGRMQVNFMTDNDITGGNSGSPVLNAEGKLIGLAFDGNKESLASELHYVEGYNKCICVDIRFILWTLDQYAHLDRILNELGY